jgi:DNA-binding transcriptional ArsR family regulator
VDVATVDPWVALSDRTRRSVLWLVVERPRSVTDLAAQLPVSRPAVSQHLRVLSDARLVSATQHGRERIYQAQPDGLRAVRDELERFWSQTLTNFKNLAEQSQQGGPSK